MNREELIAKVVSSFLSGGRRTTAAYAREALTDILNNCWVIEDPVNYFIMKSSGTDGHRWKITIDDTGMPQFPGEDLGI